jgi:cellulose synthase/poly-beta-1,6-N-acetylglucosamine synthase-like glycosyltransferase
MAPVVLFAGVAVLFYVLIAYPLLLGWVAQGSARPVRRARIQPSVSVIVAVHNGEAFLADKLKSILALEYPRDLVQVIVASDGSTDRSEAIAESFASQGVRLIRLARGGKPAALNAAIPTASGEILVLTDVRQVLAPDSVGLLMESFADPEVGTVSGELLIRRGVTEEESNIGLYWRFETWIRDRLASIDSMFGATGPFYAVRRELAVHIPPDMLLDDMFLPLTAFFRGYRLVVDGRARAYDYPTTLDTEFRRKVRTLAGNYQILLAFPGLLGPGNRMWLHFVSYKLGRLLIPWCLIAVAISSPWLPPPWNIVLLAGQGVFYGVAVLDFVVPAGTPLKRLSSPVRTFVVMMIAALRALSVFFVPARSLWKVTSATTK